MQDFARLAEVQFLDNLRRGASINYADLQPNPVPQTLGDAYRLLTVVSPQVGGVPGRAGGQAGRGLIRLPPDCQYLWVVTACGCLQWFLQELFRACPCLTMPCLPAGDHP